MEGKEKKHCKVCGEAYELCFACERKNSWRVHTDTAEHFYIFGVLMDYKVTQDAEKAHAALKRRGIGLQDAAGFLPGVRAMIEEIEGRVVELPAEYGLPSVTDSPSQLR